PSNPLHRRLQPTSLLDCSDCYRLERESPGGIRTHWKSAPFHGALRQAASLFIDSRSMLEGGVSMHTVRRRGAVLIVAGGLSLFAAYGVPAHHSVWAEFDRDNPVEMRGRFVSMDWINPHSWVHFEAAMADGSTAKWSAETPPPNQLIRQGWRRSDIQPGDE